MGCVSLPESKSWGLCLAQLCAKYRATLSPYPSVLKGKESCFSQDERSAIQLSLDRKFALQKSDKLCKPSI